jgi:transglutaminase-like putative cysteine protease
MRQGIGKDQKLSLSGKVRGKTRTVQIEGAAGGTQEVPWPSDVIGVAREANLLHDRKPKVGDSFDYLWYEGRLNRVVKFTATVKGIEDQALYLDEKPRKLLRVELAMEPIGDFKLPTSTLWADAATLEPLKMESDMPTFGGKMTVVRTTREAALRPVGKVPDLFDVQSVKLDRGIPDVHDQTSVTYRVRLASDVAPEKAFKPDDRQAVKNADPATKSFVLVVTAVRQPGQPVGGPAAGPGKEFLSDCFFIDWDNEPTKQHARAVAATLPANASDWQKARAVETYVNRNMRATEFSQAMATCSNVAKTLSGDCTEYAMFAAGICRALGVPSRTALGLVYATDRTGKPFMAYHMWFEVYVNGGWVALDATLGRGSVGPGHLKITDASWHEEKSFAPLLPVLTVLSAQPQVEVLRVVGR